MPSGGRVIIIVIRVGKFVWWNMLLKLETQELLTAKTGVRNTVICKIRFLSLYSTFVEYTYR
jgi:hypothetical protein